MISRCNVVIILVALFVMSCSQGGNGTQEDGPVSTTVARAISTDLSSKGWLNMEIQGFSINNSGQIIASSSSSSATSVSTSSELATVPASTAPNVGVSSATRSVGTDKDVGISGTSYRITFSDIVFSSASDLTASVMIRLGSSSVMTGSWRPEGEREISIRPVGLSAWSRFRYEFIGTDTIRLTYMSSSTSSSSTSISGTDSGTGFPASSEGSEPATVAVANPLPSWLVGSWCFESGDNRTGLIRGVIFLDAATMFVYLFGDPQIQHAFLADDAPILGRYFLVGYNYSGSGAGHPASLKISADSTMDAVDGYHVEGDATTGTTINHYRRSGLERITADTTIDQACPPTS